MKFKLRLGFLCLLFASVQFFSGCFHFRSGNELVKFDRCEFSYRNPQKSNYFSVLFLPGDTIFLKRYSSFGSDQLFYSLLPLGGRPNLDSFVKRTDWLIDSMEDNNPGEERLSLYKFYKGFPNEEHSLYVHSLTPPKVVTHFIDWVNTIKDSSTFILIDTSINFKDDEIIHQAMNKNSR